MEKIYITGTGRCGTTFLIKLFTFLEYDTGFTEKNYTKYIFSNCNSGMEKLYNDKFYIIKNPNIISDIKKIINDKSIIIKTIIIPIRDFKSSAKSRVSHKNKSGGLWNASDLNSQILFYNKIISNYIFYMTKYNINTIFIDFDEMIKNRKYLFNKLKPILDEKDIDFSKFSIIYKKVSKIS